jgi:hypothetical protein
MSLAVNKHVLLETNCEIQMFQIHVFPPPPLVC